MKSNWKEMNCKEKVLAVLYLVFGVLGIVFAVADFAKLWEHADICWMFAFSVLCGVECLQKWNVNRRVAIIELIFSVAMLVMGIGSLFFL